MAHVTEHLGFRITTAIGFEHPYPFARRMSTLDHLTKGRIGWNVVTGYLPSGARNLGDPDQLAHDDRLRPRRLEVLYKAGHSRPVTPRRSSPPRRREPSWPRPSPTSAGDSRRTAATPTPRGSTNSRPSSSTGPRARTRGGQDHRPAPLPLPRAVPGLRAAADARALARGAVSRADHARSGAMASSRAWGSPRSRAGRPGQSTPSIAAAASSHPSIRCATPTVSR